MEQQLYMSAGVYSAPKLYSRDMTSSDAYFLSESSFGIADGIKEWEKVGLNAQLFASELMEACRMHVQTSSLRGALLESHRSSLNFGSSTVLLASLSENVLSVLNLGDSSLAVVREVDKNHSVVFRTRDQNHAFHCPYQLAHLPRPDEYSQLETQGLTKLIDLLKRQKKTMDDSAYDALLDTVVLQPKDVLVAATDALFDNLYEQEICDVLSNKNDKPSQLARKLVMAAQRRAVDREYTSPFATAAQEAGFRYHGGRNDDMLVLVACIF